MAKPFNLEWKEAVSLPLSFPCPLFQEDKDCFMELQLGNYDMFTFGILCVYHARGLLSCLSLDLCGIS